MLNIKNMFNWTTKLYFIKNEIEGESVYVLSLKYINQAKLFRSIQKHINSDFGGDVFHQIWRL